MVMDGLDLRRFNPVICICEADHFWKQIEVFRGRLRADDDVGLEWLLCTILSTAPHEGSC